MHTAAVHKSFFVFTFKTPVASTDSRHKNALSHFLYVLDQQVYHSHCNYHLTEERALTLVTVLDQ